MSPSQVKKLPRFENGYKKDERSNQNISATASPSATQTQLF